MHFPWLVITFITSLLETVVDEHRYASSIAIASRSTPPYWPSAILLQVTNYIQLVAQLQMNLRQFRSSEVNMFVWCLTARQHWIGQLAPTAGE